ncbi:MAG: UDP-N-acetylglucosamine--N-acetylmuramyl-(pentapeptide) pyrophosphoryl-undecaprenol N-acetylglucosamine transferase [Wolbachia endosymbiont of Ctenocephalides orientis wCori]|nr:MAG: UDP-N-acetylglucosamine--N-acetylmuramyl-(pentapeptide) pyrophosphoryl-undecaprenol N-acetylglucosamine transferase [Wolbachia endosymbiont of Ctenocephalides orientis wCori]
MNIILATGGTGGHIFPAITLARALKVHGYSCTLFLDKKIEENPGIKQYVLPLCKSSRNKFKFFFLLLYSFVLALNKIRKLKPKMVIGFGSYASFPTLIATRILAIPIVLHEQNIILGRVNRFFFKSAKLVATSFPSTKYANESKCIYTGNFISMKKQNYPSIKRAFNILIIAGSQGASFFDDVISSVICNLPIELSHRIKVIQQCIKKNITNVENSYKNKKIECEISEFFNDMENRLANAHLVISRAGATSIAEITLAERPAIYIPYPHSKDDHQLYNAQYIENSGAAIVVKQNSEAKENLAELIIDLLNNSDKLYDMVSSTKNTGIKDGVTEFIEKIRSINDE